MAKRISTMIRYSRVVPQLLALSEASTLVSATNRTNPASSAYLTSKFPAAQTRALIWFLLPAVLVVVAVMIINGPPAAAQSGTLSPSQPRQWQPLSLSFDGPSANETDTAPNPFLDYRLQVTFTGPGGQVYNVPGFFDGNGTGGGSGNVWRVRFTPDQAGSWSYRASFRSGANIAVDLSATSGTPTSFDGASGTFTVAARDATAPGFLKWGRLEYQASGPTTTRHYLKFRDGSYWIKSGVDSPENWLGFSDFDSTPNASLNFANHVTDWRTGDPTWGNGKGKGIIGALNYLASKQINSIYFLPMNIGGDAKDTWPFAGIINRNGSTSNDNLHYDISKLAQWEIVFTHAQHRGIHLHVVLNEAEGANKNELDNGTLGTERKLFYRELIARFAHHNALQWNISEEYNYDSPWPASRVKEFAGHIKTVDPYHHPIAVHYQNFGDPVKEFDPFLGDTRFTSTSTQDTLSSSYGTVVESLRSRTAASGQPLPIFEDEFWALNTVNADRMRREWLWPTYLSGGAGIEYFGLNGDQLTHDFRPYATMWDYSWYARRFLEENLPFWEMSPADALLSNESSDLGGGQVFVKAGAVYAIYLPKATATGTLNLSNASGTFTQRWYNPRTGAFEGGTTTVNGGGQVSLGSPPSAASEDWVVLLKATQGGSPASSSIYLPLVRRDPPATAQPTPTPLPQPSPTPLPRVFPGSSWQTVSPEQVGMNGAQLQQAINRLPGNIMVVRHGYLVASKGEIEKKIAVYSVSKSLTALIFGVAQQQSRAGYDDLLPNSDVPSAPRASFRHFMSMTSDYGLTPHAPGMHYAYNNQAVHFYGEYMSDAFFDSKSPDAIFQEQVWQIIGRQDAFGFSGLWGGWGGGFQMSTRDLARIGLLVLSEGKWNNRQLIPASFVEQLYHNQIPGNATMSTSPGQGKSGNNTVYNQQAVSQELAGNYSFGWWTNANNDYTDIPMRTIYALGKGGNRIIVDPEHDLVIVATWNGDTYPNANAYLKPVIDAIK